MASLEKSLVQSYINIKSSINISTEIKETLVNSICNDGIISKDEIYHIDKLIENEEKKGNKSIKKDFDNLIKNLYSSETKTFSPQELEFSVKNNSVVVKTINTDNINSIELFIPNKIYTFLKKGISENEKNFFIKNLDNKNNTIFSKSLIDIDNKIKEFNNKILSLDESSPDKNKLEKIRKIYVSIKNIINTFSKEFHPNNNQIKNLDNEINKAYEQLRELPNYLSDNELKDNINNFSKLQNIISDFHKITTSFLKYGGKIESSSNNLNEFIVQTLARLGDPNRNITKNIEGALKSFGYDISDMKIFNDRFTELLKKVDRGSFKNIEQAIVAFRAVAPKTSNKFLNNVSKLGSSAQKNYEAKLAIKESEKDLQAANKNITKGSDEVKEGNKQADRAIENINSAKSEEQQGNLQEAAKKINLAEEDNNQSKSTSNNAKLYSNNANKLVDTANKKSYFAKNRLNGANSDLISISSEFKNSLSPTIKKEKSNIAQNQTNLNKLNNEISQTKKDLSNLNNDIKNLDSKIEFNNKDISTEKSTIKNKEEASNKRLENKNNQIDFNSEDKKVLYKIIENSSNDPELAEAIKYLGTHLLDKSSDGKRVIDYLKDLQNSDKLILGVDKKELINSIIFNLSSSMNVYQGHHNSCGAGSIEVFIINKNSSEYVKIISDLAINGTSTLKDGTSISISNLEKFHNYLYGKASGENRNAADMILQDAIMNRISLVPSLTGYSSYIDDSSIYENKKLGNFYSTTLGSGNAQPYAVANLLKSITGEDYDVLLSENLLDYEPNFIKNKRDELSKNLTSSQKEKIEAYSPLSNLEQIKNNYDEVVKNGGNAIFSIQKKGQIAGHFFTGKGEIKKNDQGEDCIVIKDTNLQTTNKNDKNSQETLIPIKQFFSKEGFNLYNNEDRWVLGTMIMKKNKK
ncbi:MAG: hypothetical protein U0457_18125 [Candidatus Sericytochromatia bacterium]